LESPVTTNSTNKISNQTFTDLPGYCEINTTTMPFLSFYKKAPHFCGAGLYCNFLATALPAPGFIHPRRNFCCLAFLFAITAVR